MGLGEADRPGADVEGWPDSGAGFGADGPGVHLEDVRQLHHGVDAGRRLSRLRRFGCLIAAIQR